VNANPSTLLARAVLEALVAGGVTEVVLSPGSRNAPLAFAAHDAERAGLLRLHTRVDERTAGFLALGLTKVGARAAVMCTSGTAVANLHPAVLEAAHAGLPLVVVTADRPASVRGTGASQTTDQVRIFGTAARVLDLVSVEQLRAVHGAAALAATDTGRGPRPVHLNVQFSLPLVPDAPWAGLDKLTTATSASTPDPADLVDEISLSLGPRTVVVAGDDAGPPARVLAQAANWPLFAEPTAGCRTGPNALRCYRLLLACPLAERIERVVVAGHPTLSRPVNRLLERSDVEVVSLRSQGLWPVRPFPVAQEAWRARVEEPGDPAWLAEWLAADADVSARLDGLLRDEQDLTPHEVAGVVSAGVPPSGLLFVGASSPIRDLDVMAHSYRVGDRRKILANRGLAGIDGTISSAIGAALGRPHGSRNLALMGDVTFLHDANALVIGPDDPRPDLTIVVVNDDGGSIFAMLEQGDPEYADRYDRLFGTPHHVDLASLCAATRTPHWKVESLAELEHALASPAGGIEVVEVVVRRDNRRELDARIRALAPT
jgi:2-succinyl-5-enolpyruvyl-6-hydroxy-3-cyclohexene-1-carboxylate synthase